MLRRRGVTSPQDQGTQKSGRGGGIDKAVLSGLRYTGGVKRSYDKGERAGGTATPHDIQVAKQHEMTRRVPVLGCEGGVEVIK